MAVVKLLPRKAAPSQGRKQSMEDRLDYDENPDKTRDVYAAYKKSRDKESFRSRHKDELEKHEAAKVAFDALGGKTIPKVAELSKEYAALLEEKKQCYEEYKAARQEMIDFQTAKRNVDVILGWDEAARKKQQDREH